MAERVRDLLGVTEPDVDASGRHRLRWDPGRRGATAFGVVAVVVIAVAIWWLTRTPPQSTPVSVGSSLPLMSSGASSAVSPLPSSSPSSSSSAAGEIVVDVAGKVSHPGIYRLPAGARVFDAVQAAGGARPGVSTVALNLAAPLQDGQQVVVGVSGAPPALAPPASGGSSAAVTVVDLNTATLDQLDTLPGVGPVLAQHILDWRSAHGRFESTDQLNDVSGIGEVKFAELRPLVTAS